MLNSIQNLTFHNHAISCPAQRNNIMLTFHFLETPSQI